MRLSGHPGAFSIEYLLHSGAPCESPPLPCHAITTTANTATTTATAATTTTATATTTTTTTAVTAAAATSGESSTRKLDHSVVPPEILSA